MHKFIKILSKFYDSLIWKPEYIDYNSETNSYEKRFDFKVPFNLVFLTIISFLSIIGFSYLKENLQNVLNIGLEPFILFTCLGFWIFLWLISLYFSIRLNTGSFLFNIFIELGVILSSLILWKIGFAFLFLSIFLYLYEKILIGFNKLKIKKKNKNEISKTKNNISK